MIREILAILATRVTREIRGIRGKRAIVGQKGTLAKREIMVIRVKKGKLGKRVKVGLIVPCQVHEA